MRRRTLLAGAIAAPFGGLAFEALAQAPKPPSLEELVRQTVVVDASISPNGEQIAVLKRQKVDEPKKRSEDPDKIMAYVSLHGFADLDKRIDVPLGDVQVAKIAWANDERLLIWLIIADPPIPIPRRVASMSLDGKDFVVLLGKQEFLTRSNLDMWIVPDLLPDDPRRIVMLLPSGAGGNPGLYHVDVYTGEATLLERGVQGTNQFFLQNGVPVIRVDYTRPEQPRPKEASLKARAPGQTEWKEVRRFRVAEEQDLDFQIIAPAPEAAMMYAFIGHRDAPSSTIRKFNLHTLETGEVVAQRQDRDIYRCVLDKQGRFAAAEYRDDRISYEFAEPGMATDFKDLSGAFNNLCDVEIRDISADRNRWLARVSGPQNPGVFVVFDRQKPALGFLGEQQPWLVKSRLAPMLVVDVQTRDKTMIRAYLTAPLDSRGKKPLVVLPHGGPESRDGYSYDLFAQVLAAQGWFVLQPNFRGSDGYGRTFADGGRRQWNGRVMEDVEDAVDFVLKSGLVDPQKVAIMGASFGGYAALMQAVRRPSLYKSVVAIAGVFDLLDMLDDEQKEGNDSASYKYWLRTMGHPKDDRDMLLQASPSKQADKIEAPVLLLHGWLDTTVPIRQSQLMQSALQRARKSVTYKDFRRAGHGGWDAETSESILGEAVKFIAANFS